MLLLPLKTKKPNKLKLIQTNTPATTARAKHTGADLGPVTVRVEGPLGHRKPLSSFLFLFSDLNIFLIFSHFLVSYLKLSHILVSDLLFHI
jgi:hypothetical protein